MSFIGRAAVWTHLNGAGNAMDGNRRPASTGARLTPLEIMTGSRIAASGHGGMGLGFTVGGQTWDEPPRRRSGGPLPTDQPRSPYQQLFDAISRRTNRPESRACTRCGQPPHNDWGHEYERLVCQEITAA